MSYRSALLAVALATGISPTLPAQAPAAAPATPSPYRVLSIAREAVKPGKSSAHDKLESEWARGLSAARMPFGSLAMTSTTGVRENWYVSGFPSYAEYAKANKAFNAIPALAAVGTRLDPQEADLVSDARGMLLLMREDLSYGPPADLPTMRFMSVSRISLRPGHVPEFEDARKVIKQAHETAHLTDSYAVYEATAGAPAGTFYIFVARKSLAELDDSPRIHGAEYLAALGGDEGRRKMAANASNYLNGSQTDHFAFVPSQSIVSAAWAAGDPTYWKLRTTPTAP
jgi:hypothetical protein